MSLRTLPLVAALWACIVPAALAGNLSATAYQNLVDQEQDFSPGPGPVQVIFGNASASADRHQVSSSALGEGSTVTTQFGGAAGASSSYMLWDMTRDQALDVDTASFIWLTLHFKVVGHLDVGTTSTSVASTLYQGSVSNLSHGLQSFSESLTVSYGPVTGGVDDFTRAGDLGLEGDYTRWYSAAHMGGIDGTINLSVTNVAGNDAFASSTLSLDHVRLRGGPEFMPEMIGIRFVETGQVIPAVVVPEPGTVWLLVAGAGLVLVRVAARGRGRA